MATRGSYVHISMGELSGHPDNISFMQFSTKIDGFEQKDSQGFENSYNSYEQYPLEKFFIFTIYQNYTLALTFNRLLTNPPQELKELFLFVYLHKSVKIVALPCENQT